MQTKLFLLAAVAISSFSALAETAVWDRSRPASSITNNRFTSVFVMPAPDLSAYPTSSQVQQAITNSPSRGPGSVSGIGSGAIGDFNFGWSGFAGTNVTSFSFLCLVNGPTFTQNNPGGSSWTAFLPNMSKPLGVNAGTLNPYYFPPCPAGSSGYVTAVVTPSGDNSGGVTAE